MEDDLGGGRLEGTRGGTTPSLLCGSIPGTDAKLSKQRWEAMGWLLLKAQEHEAAFSP